MTTADETVRGATHARVAVATIIAAVAIGAIAYRLILANHLQQTAALFVGIPALLAIIVVFGVSPKSATGVACKAVTIGLLVSLIFLWEGMLCVLMSAPLFYAVAIVVTRFVQFMRGTSERTITLRSCAAVLVVIPMTLEGIAPSMTFDRRQSVSVTRSVPVSAEAIARALLDAPRFERELPPLLRAGFPSPVASRIEQVPGGRRWIVQMRGGEMLLNGMEPRRGELTLALEEMGNGIVRWRAVSDTSHMTHFLAWREVTVQWQAIDKASTRVTWTVQYDRGLDPAWYFGPIERYAVRLAAGYLIEAVATP